MPVLDQVVNRFTMVPYLPYKEPELAKEMVVNIAPNSTILGGTVLGQVAAAANEVQTVTLGASNTGGTFTLTVSSPIGSGTTTALAYNAASATVQAALVAIVGSGNVTATGSAGGPYTVTFLGTLAGMPLPFMTGAGAMTGGTNTVTIAHGTVGSTLGTYAAYVNAGTYDPARVILKYDVTTDANGNILGQWGQTYQNAIVYTRGVFRTLTLIGWDSGARVDLGAHLESGSDTDGVVRIGC
jgi:hypothetical protein